MMCKGGDHRHRGDHRRADSLYGKPSRISLIMPLFKTDAMSKHQTVKQERGGESEEKKNEQKIIPSPEQLLP